MVLLSNNVNRVMLAMSSAFCCGVSSVLMQAILFGCSILASLNLPAALEDLSGATVPPSLLEKAEQIRQLGGIDGLRQKMNNLPDLLQRNKEILDEVCVILIYLKFYLVRNCFVEKCYGVSIHCTGLSLGLDSVERCSSVAYS